MDKITFGKFIRDNRRQAGMTQTELAHALGVNSNSIGNIERGQTFPEAEKLFRLITILDLSIDSLMFTESRLGESLLPAAINEKIAALSDGDRKIVVDVLTTLVDALSENSAVTATTEEKDVAENELR